MLSFIMRTFHSFLLRPIEPSVKLFRSVGGRESYYAFLSVETMRLLKTLLTRTRDYVLIKEERRFRSRFFHYLIDPIVSRFLTS